MLNLASSILILFGIFILTLSVHEKFDLINFKNKVLEDDRVWLLEFYSPMCGSCTEFSPTWSKLETSAKSIVTSKVNIDDKAGMELAKALGVLEEGLPGVRIFTSKTGNGISIVAGNADIGLKQIMKSIKENLKGLPKSGGDGVYLKSGSSSHQSRELSDTP